MYTDPKLILIAAAIMCFTAFFAGLAHRHSRIQFGFGLIAVMAFVGGSSVISTRATLFVTSWGYKDAAITAAIYMGAMFALGGLSYWIGQKLNPERTIGSRPARPELYPEWPERPHWAPRKRH